ncbi:MAG TPA: flagellar basal body rod protein FlgB [Candidatus Solibacter sp.]|nr:flagellar basal body rod protein FlgB [Candidatus Solibacter sp.]
MATISSYIPGGMIDTAMTEALGRFLDVDVARYQLISENLANIDTPGYRTRDLDFRGELRRAAAEANGARETGLVMAEFRPVSHGIRGLIERPDGNNVSLERESLALAEAQMKFNLGVQLLKEQFHLISTAINSGGSSS